MSITFDRVEHLCKMNNITVNALEINTGTNHGTIQKWKNKDDVNPSSSLLVKIADYFNVSVDYLLGRCDNLTSHIDESSIFKVYGQLYRTTQKLEKIAGETKRDIHQILEDAGLESILLDATSSKDDG